MADVGTLIGRDDAVELIRDLANRPAVNGRRRNRLRPVLVVEGARGSGKSALLRDVAGRLDQRAPFARIDFEAGSAAQIPELLSAVAFAFGRYCPGYGVITFPRLAIARLVMQQKLDLGSRRTAIGQVTSLLAAERGLNTLRAGLGRAAGTAVDVLQGRLNLPEELSQVLRDAGDEATRSAFSSVLGGRRTRRIALGRYVGWFGHRDRGLTHDPVDMLIELNRWADDPEAGDHRQAIDELVWDAFLTDLRGHFRDKDADDWRFTCVLLMDNADTRVGQEFVTGLVRGRGTRRDDPDPLTAVVTSTGGLLAHRDPDEIADGSLADGETRWQRFRRHRLSDLSTDDTINLIANTGLRTGNTPRLPIMIHQLTEGHPAATQLMITTVAQHESIRDQPVTLLGRLEPGAGPDRLTVAERLRADLLGEFPNESLEELITCAAATDVEHLRALTQISTGSERLLNQIEQSLWPHVAEAGPRLLRRLLLPLLAERQSSHPASWERVFEQLRAGRASVGDECGELYYALAAGDLPHVVVALEENLEKLSCQEWCELLLLVTAAPRRPASLASGGPGVSGVSGVSGGSGPSGGPAPSPDEQCRALLRRPAPVPVAGRIGSSIELARLVAGLWIVNDPLTDARRRGLHEQIADDFEWLAGSSPQDNVQCYRQSAHRHRRWANLWPWN